MTLFGGSAWTPEDSPFSLFDPGPGLTPVPDRWVVHPTKVAPVQVWVALKQETFSGLPGHPPKTLLAPLDSCQFRGNPGVRELYQSIGVARVDVNAGGPTWQGRLTRNMTITAAILTLHSPQCSSINLPSESPKLRRVEIQIGTTSTPTLFRSS